jgi:hypothetical protein
VQLETPHARTANKTSHSSPFLRRLHPNGNSTSAHTSGTAPQPTGKVERAEDPACPVDTSTVTFPVTPAFSVSVAGLKTQTAFVGSVPHWN